MTNSPRHSFSRVDILLNKVSHPSSCHQRTTSLNYTNTVLRSYPAQRIMFGAEPPTIVNCQSHNEISILINCRADLLFSSLSTIVVVLRFELFFRILSSCEHVYSALSGVVSVYSCLRARVGFTCTHLVHLLRTFQPDRRLFFFFLFLFSHHGCF